MYLLKLTSFPDWMPKSGLDIFKEKDDLGYNYRFDFMSIDDNLYESYRTSEIILDRERYKGKIKEPSCIIKLGQNSTESLHYGFYLEYNSYDPYY